MLHQPQHFIVLITHLVWTEIVYMNKSIDNIDFNYLNLVG